MAFAETANLIARLSLKDEFSRPLAGAKSKLSGFGAAASRTGKAIGVGLGAGLAVGTVAISHAISNGLHSLDELENATTSVDAAIKQMGLTGQVTAGEIATWANEIEKSVGAAFDDKAITQAATTLIRYGKLSTENLRPALVVMTDLAAKTGSVESAATLLAKALADPAKAAGRLTRAGVTLTDAEQKQIKALVKVGKTAQAQKVVLDALTKSTKGAAAASQGTYARSLSTLKDVIEDAERALAEGFLPVIEKVRDILSTELAKPQTLANIREFGKGLAGGLGNLIDIARGLPWGAIGDALKIGGAGAKIVLDAFTAMPPWVQTAIATGWGLNKITGGAVSGIIGQVASGLIKGVLGINAGVVNIKAATVTGGGGGIPGAAGGAAKGGLGLASKLFLVGEAIGLIAAVNEVRDNIAGELTNQTKGIHDAVSNQINDQKSTSGQLAQSLAGVNQGIEALSHDPIGNALLGDQLGELQKMRDELGSALRTQDDANKANFRQVERDDRSNTATTKQAIDSARDKIEASRIALSTRLGDTRQAVVTGNNAIVGAIGNIEIPTTPPLGPLLDAIDRLKPQPLTPITDAINRWGVAALANADAGDIVDAITETSTSIVDAILSLKGTTGSPDRPSGMVWKPSDKVQIEDRRGEAANARDFSKQRDAIEASRIALASKTAAVKTSIDRDRDAVESARIAIRSTEGTVRTGSQSIVSALGSQRMSATVPIQIYVNGVLTKTTTQETTLASNTGRGSTTVPGHSGI